MKALHAKMWEMIAQLMASFLHNTAPADIGVVIIYYSYSQKWVQWGSVSADDYKLPRVLRQLADRIANDNAKGRPQGA